MKRKWLKNYSPLTSPCSNTRVLVLHFTIVVSQCDMLYCGATMRFRVWPSGSGKIGEIWLFHTRHSALNLMTRDIFRTITELSRAGRRKPGTWQHTLVPAPSTGFTQAVRGACKSKSYFPYPLKIIRKILSFLRLQRLKKRLFCHSSFKKDRIFLKIFNGYGK